MADERVGSEIESEPSAELSEKNPLPKLTLGRANTSSVSTKVHSRPFIEAQADGELEAIAIGCRTKAEAARWVAEHQRRLHEWDQSPDDDGPTDPEIKAWAESLANAYYWAVAEDRLDSLGIESLDEVGGCFETLAECLELVRRCALKPKSLDRALPLLAEAQSAVRAALQRLHMKDDPHQLEIYEWLRLAAARHRVFLKRFMRADDLAKPADWPKLLTRIEAEQWGGLKSERQKALFEGIRSQLEGPKLDWSAALALIAGLIEAGVSASNRELRELLLPHLDDMPHEIELPPGFERILREVDRYLATRAPQASGTISEQPPAEIREVARLLAGRSAVLIGGIRRPRTQETLKKTLGLKDMIWIETREHQSIRGFEATIARPEVALVLLAIRWSSHSFGDIQQYCDRYAKPLVRLPGGYNPAQVASQILDQCSGQLNANPSTNRRTI